MTNADPFEFSRVYPSILIMADLIMAAIQANRPGLGPTIDATPADPNGVRFQPES